MTATKQHGGKRAGAGRPTKFDEQPCYLGCLAPFTLRERLDKWAQRHDMSRSDAILAAVQWLIKQP